MMFSSDQRDARIAKAIVRAAEPPKGDRREMMARIARIAHTALNAPDDGTWPKALMQIRTAARTSLGLPPIPKGKRGDR